MDIRKAEMGDIEKILSIYEHARAYMKESGNPDQWRDSYPPRELVEKDIGDGCCFCICDGDGDADDICGVFSYFENGDSAYDNIFDGAWLDDKPYGAIHRVAGDGSRRGIFAAAADYCKKITPALKIDTHKDNKTMQRTLEKAGFRPCGTVYTDDGTERIAYHLTVTGDTD